MPSCVRVGRPWLQLLATLGVLHVAQQGIHLRQRQAAVGTYRAVAGHGRQQLVEVCLMRSPVPYSSRSASTSRTSWVASACLSNEGI